jgi:hypothetical protein
MTAFHFSNTELERLKTDQRKAEIEARIIRHFRVGYILILFTPVVSVLVFCFVILGLASVSQNYILTDTAFTAWNVLIVTLLIIGIALYMYGYLKREATGTRARVILIGFILILWGVFTYLVATGFLSDAISRSMYPEMRALTIWDYVSYWMWEMKGIFGIGTGLLLITTSILKIITSLLKTHSPNKHKLHADESRPP